MNLPDMAPKVLALLRAEDPEIAAKFGTDDEDKEEDDGPVSEADTSEDEVTSP